MQIMQQLGQAIVQSRSFQDASQRVCQVLRRELPHYHWVGVYRVRGEKLALEAWDGPQATQHVQISIGEGICGLAAREAKTVIVDDVNQDPRYLPCFLQTKSEIVVPILKGKKVVGEIDIDSDKPAAFHTLDRLFLEWVADLLSQKT
jgi:L-methionine (R)-S-oxide reductase